MGVFDKIKNALFEVEYVEVEEPPKKEKKTKPKEKTKIEKPIAKKIVLPEKKENKIEKKHDEVHKQSNIEVKSSDESFEEKVADEFKFMDDRDFTVENDDYPVEEPKILEVIDDKRNDYNDSHMMFSNQKLTRDRSSEKSSEFNNFSYDSSEKTTTNFVKPYGMDSSYSVPVHEYGTYEKKEEKTYFKPSPIISPIYGILDKNYKKEDVVQKKEIRLSTNYTRNKVSVDDIRNKAYGEHQSVENSNLSIDLEPEEDDNLLVDLSDRAKPEVKELTMGDAMEYFQDLGLEYNVDYVDVSKERVTGRRLKEKYDDDPVQEEKQSVKQSLNDKKNDLNVDSTSRKPMILNSTEIKSSIKKEEIVESFDDDNDNLFDLIDSMYQDSD